MHQIKVRTLRWSVTCLDISSIVQQFNKARSPSILLFLCIFSSSFLTFDLYSRLSDPGEDTEFGLHVGVSNTPWH